MVNSTYHGEHIEPLPIKRLTKKIMIEWLQGNWVDFPPKVCRNEIFGIVQQQNTMAMYIVDDLVAAADKKFPMMTTHNNHKIEFLGRA